MVTMTRLKMSDISRQKRFETDLSGNLTPRHTVAQAIEHYLQEKRIPSDGTRWTAFTRGIRLDSKQALENLTDADSEWTVMPEVSAGAKDVDCA